MELSAEDAAKLLNTDTSEKLRARPRPQHEVLRAQLLAEGKRFCPCCKEIKTLDNFTKNKARKDGFKVYCKACQKAKREETREYNIAKSREWREANPERFAEKRDAWMQTHPQSKNPTRKNWEKANTLKLREIKKRYKLRREGWEVGQVDYLEILIRDNFVCHICGTDVEPDDIHFDHVIPLSKGGQHSTDNIHVAHSRCNIRKSNKILEDEQAIQRLLDRIRVEEAG